MPAWTKDRIEAPIGEHEWLTIEFKKHEALISADGKDLQARLDEAARDLAAMLTRPVEPSSAA